MKKLTLLLSLIAPLANGQQQPQQLNLNVFCQDCLRRCMETRRCAGEVKESITESCVILPKFQASDVTRMKTERGIDRIFYELSFIEKTSKKLMFYDLDKNKIETIDVVEKKNLTKVFETTEDAGDENFIVTQVNAFLKSQTIFICQ